MGHRLFRLATLGLVGVGLSATYRLTGYGIPCPWRALTGTLCPFCGSTSMGAHLLNLDFAGAWAANQFVFSLGVVVAVASVFWIVEALGGPTLRLPQRWRDQRLWLWPVIAIGLAFTIARNL